ncbi:peptide deformylase [Candidatus Oscillochloris fontis]|uniref:peptide deformylase n=1 Tax=Candidatus Oscillochloris fontis TaxID=2496868 RepID=UPI00101BD50C|nr:peptide deformylase [Candidatus Oscillochloris fontis]
MSTRRIFRIDNSEDKKTLKMQCRPVKLPDPNLKQLVADMFETMRKAHGVGLAAPQVGLPIQLCIVEIPAEIEQLDDGTEVEVAPAEQYVLINPRIVKTSGDEIMRDEGCLSLPGWYGMVPRHSWVTVEYQEPNGKVRRLRKADGLLGWAIQHEVDHLHGVLFTERIRDLSTLRDVSKQPDELVAA